MNIERRLDDLERRALPKPDEHPVKLAMSRLVGNPRAWAEAKAIARDAMSRDGLGRIDGDEGALQ